MESTVQYPLDTVLHFDRAESIDSIRWRQHAFWHGLLPWHQSSQALMACVPPITFSSQTLLFLPVEATRFDSFGIKGSHLFLSQPLKHFSKIQDTTPPKGVMVQLTIRDHTKAVNIARRLSAQNENDLMRKSEDPLNIVSFEVWNNSCLFLDIYPTSDACFEETVGKFSDNGDLRSRTPLSDTCLLTSDTPQNPPPPANTTTIPVRSSPIILSIPRHCPLSARNILTLSPASSVARLTAPMGLKYWVKDVEGLLSRRDTNDKEILERRR